MYRILFVMFGVLISMVSFAKKEIDKENFKFCAYGPEVRIVGGNSSKRKCSDRVKIQAVMWKCCSEGNVRMNNIEFFKKIRSAAKRECRNYCSGRGAGCNSRFIAPLKCGFQVGNKYAKIVGQKFHCSDRCEGKFISYCSIYHAGYLKSTQSQLRGKPPNCLCYKN